MERTLTYTRVTTRLAKILNLLLDSLVVKPLNILLDFELQKIKLLGEGMILTYC